jgi:hypothetical protein
MSHSAKIISSAKPFEIVPKSLNNQLNDPVLGIVDGVEEDLCMSEDSEPDDDQKIDCDA